MSLFARLIAVCLLTYSIATPATAGGDPANGEALAATCAACHGPQGQSTVPTNPKLAGQYESYLLQALMDYKSGARQNAIMSGFAASLSDQDMKDLAAWFASQDGELRTANP